MDVRKGDRGLPIAVKTPQGWSLLGPSLSPSVSTTCSVNFVNHKDKGIEQMIETPWSTDFGDRSSVLDQPHSRGDKC